MYLVRLRLNVPESLKEGLKEEATRRRTTVSKLVTAILEEGLVIFADQDVNVPRKYDAALLKKKNKKSRARLPVYESF